MDTMRLAEHIYLAVYGQFDSKTLRNDKLGEIYDWLHNGNEQFIASSSLQKLVAEWREYDSQAAEGVYVCTGAKCDRPYVPEYDLGNESDELDDA